MIVSNITDGCRKDGKVHIFNGAEERFSWRALYALPTAGLAFPAIDLPVSVCSLTGYLISEALP
ncbi:MAG: hypothetical protein ACI4OS_03755 [Akkermansia sp.]